MANNLIRIEDKGEAVQQPTFRRTTFRGRVVGAVLLFATGGAAALGLGAILDGDNRETRADVYTSVPACGDQKDGSKGVIIVAERNATVTVRPDDSKDNFVSLVVEAAGKFRVTGNPGAEQPPLHPGQDQDVKNFDFDGKLRLSIDPEIWPGPGDRTQLTIARDCPR